MLRIAIVEDEQAYSQVLEKYCQAWAGEKGLEIVTDVFDNPVDFLEKYHAEYDVIFMDIVMPLMDGMTCAKKLREKDENVVLCFITSMAQYAIRGYEVGAFDFILKPVSQTEFNMKLDRIMRLLDKRIKATVLVNSRNKVNNIVVRDLLYVEVFNHMLIYHTKNEEYEAYGKLSELEKDERFNRFIRVSSSHLVNCDHISSLGEDYMIVNNSRLPVSRRRRKDCLEKMAVLLARGRV